MMMPIIMIFFLQLKFLFLKKKLLLMQTYANLNYVKWKNPNKQ